jgi:hypothetical protein
MESVSEAQIAIAAGAASAAGEEAGELTIYPWLLWRCRCRVDSDGDAQRSERGVCRVGSWGRVGAGQQTVDGAEWRGRGPIVEWLRGRRWNKAQHTGGRFRNRNGGMVGRQ